MSASTQLGKSQSAASSMPDPIRFEFLDLKAQFATIREEVMEAVARVMESQKFILGEEVRLFESEIAAMLGTRHAVACASGSDALVLALMAAGVGPGHEVITTPFTYVATAEAITRVGARPVFVDIDPHSFNLDPKRIQAAMTPATRAILPVHLFGLPADLDPILSVANANGLFVIEDAAQAVAAQYGGRFVGTLGTLGCFSFFPSKNLGGAGDGGLVTTDDAGLADQLCLLRVHGSRKKYHHEVLGLNSRLDAIQAAILRVKLRYLEDWTRARQRVAQIYGGLFNRAKLNGLVDLPTGAKAGCDHVYNQFTIRCRERDNLREFLKTAGISTEIYYPIPLHLQPAFSYLKCHPGQYAEAERASMEVLSLPIYPELKSVQQEFIVETIALFFCSKN